MRRPGCVAGIRQVGFTLAVAETKRLAVEPKRELVERHRACLYGELAWRAHVATAHLIPVSNRPHRRLTTRHVIEHQGLTLVE
jgi:hypothetical protein